MPPEHHPSGRLLFDKHLLLPITPRHIFPCPTIDLLAIITSHNTVEVFRFTGHRAFGTKGQDDARITSIAWKSDGSRLRVFWEGEDSCDLLSNTTSFTSHRVEGVLGDDEGETERGIQPQDWKEQCSRIEPRTKSSSAAAQLQEMLDDGSDSDDSDKHLDSGRDGTADTKMNLSTIMDDSFRSNLLPKLDPPPPFRDQPLWKQLGFDRLECLTLHREPGASDNLDLLVSSKKNASGVQGSFGSFRFGKGFPDATPFIISDLSSSERSFTYAALGHGSTSATSEDLSFQLRFISFNVFPQNERSVALLGRTCHIVRDLVSYITRSVDAMRILWKAGRRAFEQQVANIEETLSELESEEDLDLPTALYELALTGRCRDQVKTWITEDMGVQGITRWYSALGASLQQILAICELSLRPAIERATVEAYTLRSQARSFERPLCDVDDKLLNALEDDVAILEDVCFSLLRCIRLEAHRTYIFSDWLMQYHMVLHDKTSAAAKDAEKKIAETDYPELIEYIFESMTKNRLNIFLGRPTDQILAAQRRPRQNPASAIINMMLKRHKEDGMHPTSPVVELINVLYLTLFINDTCNTIVESHKSKFNDTIVLSRPYPLSSLSPEHTIFRDLTMLPSSPSSNSRTTNRATNELSTYTLSTTTFPNKPPSLTIDHFTHGTHLPDTQAPKASQKLSDLFTNSTTNPPPWLTSNSSSPRPSTFKPPNPSTLKLEDLFTKTEGAVENWRKHPSLSSFCNTDTADKDKAERQAMDIQDPVSYSFELKTREWELSDAKFSPSKSRILLLLTSAERSMLTSHPYTNPHLTGREAGRGGEGEGGMIIDEADMEANTILTFQHARGQGGAFMPGRLVVGKKGRGRPGRVVVLDQGGKGVRVYGVDV